jgi:di/tricarboxylate transporter
MASDFPVEGRLFTVGLALVFLAPIAAALLASVVTPTDPNGTLDWYPVFTFVGGILMVLSYVYGRTPEERAREPNAS